MKLAILIPMDYHAARAADSLGVPGWIVQTRAIWPELYSNHPMLPADIAVELQERIEGWIRHKHDCAVIVTRSEYAVLRVQRMVAEGAALDVTIHFPGSTHPMATVGPNGEVDTWPVGLFAEDFEEVRAMRRAAEQRARTGGV